MSKQNEIDNRGMTKKQSECGLWRNRLLLSHLPSPLKLQRPHTIISLLGAVATIGAIASILVLHKHPAATTELAARLANLSQNHPVGREKSAAKTGKAKTGKAKTGKAKTGKAKTGKDYDIELSQSKFLGQIAKESGLSERAAIAICDLQRNCRHLNGDRPPVSIASLAKIPIAVALMHKVYTENISLETPIYLNPENFTEDASDLEVGRSYPLWRLLAEMLIKSSNIAPNQLIDYLGWDYINQVLQERGYRTTRVSSKFSGEAIMPWDLGWDYNISSSDELTEMMVQIYNREHPGDDVLVSLLKYQDDLGLGVAALAKSPAKWVGEKTGQTSYVLGTTLAMDIAAKKYIVTVIDDGYYSEWAIRDSVEKIAARIASQGQL